MHTGNKGEKQIQIHQGSSDKASRFYSRQMQDHLNAKMIDLISKQEMVFIATSDADGNCDCSPRFGKQGFVTVIDKGTLAYPEYRGNGVFASLGNILENPHIGMVFLDFFKTAVGLHVNGKANSYQLSNIPEQFSVAIQELSKSIETKIERWVLIQIDEAYIHCSKHVPKLEKKEKKIFWGTDNNKEKSVNFFKD
ncbi:MAG: pyridoxamine 5'-phosphate oxidase family protein [Crocinitomicaceae bacterium]